MASQSGQSMETRYGGGDQPAALFSPPGADPARDWYWVGAAARTGNTVTVLYTQWHTASNTGGGLSGFEWRKNLFARYSLPDLRLVDSGDLPYRQAVEQRD